MTDADDVCIIPEPWASEAIPAIVAGELLSRNEEYDDASGKLVDGYAKLTEMFDYFTKQVKPSRERVKITGWDFRSIG